MIFTGNILVFHFFRRTLLYNSAPRIYLFLLKIKPAVMLINLESFSQKEKYFRFYSNISWFISFYEKSRFYSTMRTFSVFFYWNNRVKCKSYWLLFGIKYIEHFQKNYKGSTMILFRKMSNMVLVG